MPNASMYRTGDPARALAPAALKLLTWRNLTIFSPLLLWMLFTAPPACLAQTGNAGIQGTVRDPSAAVVPAAQVEVTQVETGLKYQATANSVGLFLLPNLSPGEYRIAAQAPGMQNWEGVVTLRTGQDAVVEIAMRVGGTTTEVIVAGDVTPLVSTVSSTVGATIERTRIEQLPLNGRNVNNLVQAITPGLEGDAQNLRAYGLRAGSMEFVQDGAVMTNRSWGYVTGRPPGLDTVGEIKVETNNASAKSNRPAAAIIRTRAGTNQFHGALFETARNNGLGLARRREDYYDKAPPLIRNEFGASAGFPLVLPRLYDGHNRTFLFVAYEGYSRRQYSTVSTSVPTLAMREGDYSGLVNSVGQRYTLYDPWSTDSRTAMRAPFVNNQIPVARRSALATYLFKVTPAPNLPDVNPVVGSNYFGPQPSNQDQHTGTLRFDHRISDRDQFFLRFSQGRYDWVQSAGGPITLDGSANVTNTHRPSRSGALSWSRIMSPTFFSETLVNYGWENWLYVQGDEVDWAGKFGLPNPFNKRGLPEIGNTGFGMSYLEATNTGNDITGILNIDQNLTKLHGKHEFQFGGRFRHENMKSLPQQQYVKGLYNFNNYATALYDTTTGSLYNPLPRTGHDSANLFLGAMGYASFARTRDWFRFTTREYAAYLQDNWKITRRLTLNLGLRVESYPILNEVDNVITSFDPKRKAIVLGRPLDDLMRMGAVNPGVMKRYTDLGVKFETAQEAGLPEKLMRTDALVYGPRIGFAYRVTTGRRPLVLRGGYSRFAFPITLRSYAADARSNPPLATRYSLNVNTAGQSPDGKANYMLRNVPPFVAGVNSVNMVDINNPSPGAPGSVSSVNFDPYQPPSRAGNFNLTLEREAFAHLVLRAVLVGSHGSELDQYHYTNEEIPSYVWFVKTGQAIPGGDYSGVARRQWTSEPYGTIRWDRKTGWSNFSGLQLEAERKFTRGAAFQFSYVMSHSLRAGGNGWSDHFVKDARVFLDGAVPAEEKERNRFLNYQRQTQIPKHRVRLNWVLDLPFGRGKAIAGNAGRVLNGIMGGWQLAGFATMSSQWWSLPETNWGYVGKVEAYGTKYPVQDCRSGRCIPGYLYWNGYIPANRINSYDASGKPNGVMGVPKEYTPSSLPVWPTPGDGGNPADPNYRFLGGNTVFVKMQNGSQQQVALDTGLHPWQNQYLLGPMLWNADASLFKAIALTERVRVRFNADFFNVLNMPGMGTPAATGILSTQNSANSPRVVQLTLRLIW